MSYPPTPQRKACNCSDPCISTDDVYYAGPNLPNSGINTNNLLTVVIEKLDAIYAVPTLQRVTEMGNYTTLPIIADSFVKIGGDGNNILLDNGTVLPIGDLPVGVTKTSELINDGQDGIHPFITAQDIPAFDPSNYDLDEFTNTGIDPFAHVSDIPAPLGYTPVNKAGDTMLGDLILNQDPSTALGAATKQYVDNIVTGINFHAPVIAATDVSLVATYDNGVDGVGATLTGPSVGVLSIDGETPTYLQRILVWQQADAIENGIYDLTTVGDSVTVYQLTRSADADNSPPGEIHYGDYTLVLTGDTNGGFGFICNTPGTIDIGTTPINYVQFNAAQAVTAGYGLEELTPNVISINPLETQEKITLTTTGDSGAATLDDLTDTLNIPTIGVVSATETGIVNNTSLQELGGVDKTINGVRLGQGNSLDSNNTAMGIGVLELCEYTPYDEGSYNSGFGHNALSVNTLGYNNTAIGSDALLVNTLGSNNTAVGAAALVTNTTGERNTAVGAGALYYNTTGSSNTAVGISAAQFTTTGNYNVSLGYQAGSANTTGSFNIQIGYNYNQYAGLNGGSNNTFISNNLNGLGIITGSNNVVVGSPSGLSSTLSNYVIIADNSGAIRFQTTNTGLTTVPGQTNTLIDADTTGKAVVTKEYINNRLVLEKSGNYTLVNADSGGVIIFTASATLTIPNALADGFECTFVTLAGVTLTVDRGSNILYNNTGTVLLPQLSFTLKRRIATDQYITAGSL